MASIAAKLVAKDVSESIRKGKRPNLGKIAIKNGYSESTSKSPTIITETKSYKEEIEPIIVQLEKERQRIIKALANKDVDLERYATLTDSMDKITKNIQLLSGKETERQGVTINIIDYAEAETKQGKE